MDFEIRLLGLRSRDSSPIFLPLVDLISWVARCPAVRRLLLHSDLCSAIHHYVQKLVLLPFTLTLELPASSMSPQRAATCHACVRSAGHNEAALHRTRSGLRSAFLFDLLR